MRRSSTRAAIRSACCFSNFRQHYARGQDFTYDLDRRRALLCRLRPADGARRRVLPGRVHRVIYERMVDDTEAEVRALLDYCGLEFEPACLEFYKTERAVRTPSSEQVRRPIYRDATEEWSAYEPSSVRSKQRSGQCSMPIRTRPRPERNGGGIIAKCVKLPLTIARRSVAILTHSEWGHSMTDRTFPHLRSGFSLLPQWLLPHSHRMRSRRPPASRRRRAPTQPTSRRRQLQCRLRRTATSRIKPRSSTPSRTAAVASIVRSSPGSNMIASTPRVGTAPTRSTRCLPPARRRRRTEGWAGPAVIGLAAWPWPVGVSRPGANRRRLGVDVGGDGFEVASSGSEVLGQQVGGQVGVAGQGPCRRSPCARRRRGRGSGDAGGRPPSSGHPPMRRQTGGAAVRGRGCQRRRRARRGRRREPPSTRCSRCRPRSTWV